MLRTLHQLSAFCFYVLGASFFAAWLLLKNGIGNAASAVWLQVADLPLLCSAVVYGGLSLYLSLHNPERPSTALSWMIGALLAAFFLVILAMNFWPA